jgi:hypothetical protein
MSRYFPTALAAKAHRADNNNNNNNNNHEYEAHRKFNEMQ